MERGCTDDRVTVGQMGVHADRSRRQWRSPNSNQGYRADLGGEVSRDASRQPSAAVSL